MKVRHGFRRISKIQPEEAIFLHEQLSEYTTKQEPSKNDRAQNTFYTIPKIGKVAISLSSGSIVIDSHKEEGEVKEFFKQFMWKESYNEFCDNFRTSETGLHFTKFHGTVGFILDVEKAGKIPVYVSVRGGTKYADIHFKVPYEMASVERLQRGLLPPTPSPAKKYLSDAEVMQFVHRKGLAIAKDGKLLKRSNNAFYRKLEKLKGLGFLTKEGKSPAIYYPSNKT